MSTNDEPSTGRRLESRQRSGDVRSCGLSILVIEDNDDFRDMLSTLLKLRGHTVTTACDGRSGLALLLESSPQAAFIDIDLPGLDGFSIAARTRQAALERAPCLIAMTGFGQQDDRRRALAAGFDEHLVKPATIEVIEHTLRAARSRRRSQRTRAATS